MLQDFISDVFIQYAEDCHDLKIEKAHESDCCYDIKTSIDFTIKPNERKLIPNGFHLSMPNHLEGQVRSRSGLASKKGIFVLNTPGTLDAGYRGEVCTLLFNTSNETYSFKRGERIAQLKFSFVPKIVLISVDNINHFSSSRGSNGFGSTGV